MPNGSVHDQVSRKIQIAMKVDEIMTKSQSWPASLEVMEERVRTFTDSGWSDLEKGWVKRYRKLFSGTFSLLKETVKVAIGVELCVDIIEVIAAYRGKGEIIIMHSNLPRPCAHLRNICTELGWGVKSYEMGSVKPPLVTYPPVITFVVYLNGQELFLSAERFVDLGDIWKLIRGVEFDCAAVAVARSKIKEWETWVEKFLKSKKLEMSLIGPRDVFTRCMLTKLKNSDDINYKDWVQKVDSSKMRYHQPCSRPQLLVKSNGITTRVTIRYFHTGRPKATVGQLAMLKIPPPNPYEAGVAELIHSEVRRAQLKHAFEVWKLIERKNFSSKKRPSALRSHLRKRRKEMMKGKDSQHQHVKD